MDLVADIAYAIQVCDTKNREADNRVCGSNRTLLSKKSIKSFLNAVTSCANKHKQINHRVAFFNDNSTYELIEFINKEIKNNNYKNITLEIKNIDEPGIVNSILSCFKWMQDNGKEFVYLVQDDYLFIESAIIELIELQFLLKREINEYAILNPFHDNRYWNTIYKNKVTPRAVFCSKYRYWIQLYDIPCTFLIHYDEFIKHWDLYYEFLKILERGDCNLENRSLNYILVRRGVLALTPINTLAFHMQTELEEDPYIKWQPLWESINV